jgi:RNA-directed DNA polymerase
MTTMVLSSVVASSACLKEWDAIEWHSVKKQVKGLQMGIAKAIREGKHGKAKSLQWILTHSWYGKLLAVKRVVQNSGAKTPGVDAVTWRTPQQKISAVKSLQRLGYKPQPLRRVYIPKKNGKRPLDIPCMIDKAYQALYLLALEPISENLLDKNMYGFRPMRSTAGAIEQCFIALARKHSPQWILEGDIRNCFNSISHEWLKENIPTDKTMLKKWLSPGYMDKGIFYPILEGAQQGSIISPTLMNLALKGLEQSVKKIATKHDKVNVVVYADDFIITEHRKKFLRIRKTCCDILLEGSWFRTLGREDQNHVHKRRF